MIGRNLGSDVQDRVDAYKENPQALQARYTQSQELLDLLAMQKMKSEKDAYARDMKMKMEKKPSTIAQQYETELAGRTKNDILEGVSGVLKNKQNQAQSNINKVAARGVAGQPANNMLSLAGGGIVGFAGGGEVTAEILRKINISRKDFESLPKETQDTLVSSIAASTSDDDSQLSSDIDSFLGPKERRRILQNAADKAVTEAPGQFSQIGEYIFGDKESYQDVLDQRAKAEERKKYLTNLANTKESQFAPKTTGIDEKLIEDQKKLQQGQLSGLASLQKPVKLEDKKPVVSVDDFAKDKSGGITDAAAPAFDASKFAQDKTFDTKVRGGIKDLLDSDPQEAVDFAARTPAEQAMIDKLLKERTDMRDNMMNPDKLSNDKLLQTLLGAKGATPGEAFRTSGLAGINAERNQENMRRSEFDAINKLFLTEADKSQGIKQKAFEGSQADKKQGVASGTSLTANDKTAAMNAEKLLQEMSNSKVANSLKEDLNDIQKQRNSIMATGNTVKSNTQILKLYKDTETKQLNSLRKIAAEKRKNAQLLNKKDKDKTIAAIDKELKADIDRTLRTIALDSAPFQQSLKELSTGKTGGINSKFTPGQSNFKVS